MRILLFILIIIYGCKSDKKINLESYANRKCPDGLVCDTIGYNYFKKVTIDTIGFDSIYGYILCNHSCTDCFEFKTDISFLNSKNYGNFYYYEKFKLNPIGEKLLAQILTYDIQNKGPESTCCLKYAFEGYRSGQSFIIAKIDDCYMLNFEKNGYMSNSGINILKKILESHNKTFHRYWNKSYFND